jgi:hypothetical protein
MEVPLKKGILSLVILTSIFALVFLTVNVAPVRGQTDTGLINGTVSDSTGAVVPNAKIRVKSIATGAERVSATDDRGFYSVSGLPAGLYAVTVEATNLAKKEIRAEVTVGGRVEANVTLSIGVTSTVIEVVGEGGVNVNTETATIGTVIDSQQIQQLPTLNRNPYTFAQYVGTASDGDPSARGVGVSFNGLRSAGTNVLLNGAANNDEFTAMVGQTVPLDSVQEYSVLTNNFTSEFGRATSAVVNLVTKTGTNEFHGSAYEYNRVSALSTESFYNKANDIPKSHYTRNQFGGALGGPIKKEKLFFFGNAEWNRIRSDAQSSDYILDPSFIANYAGPGVQSFYQALGTVRSGLQYNHANDVAFDPGTFCSGKPTSSSIINTTAFNNANGFYTCTSGGAVIGNKVVPSGVPFLDSVSYAVPSDAGAGNPTNQVLVVGSVQWNISDKTSLTGIYALNKYNLFPGSVNNSAYANYDTGENVMQNSFNLSVTHSFSTTTTMQNRVVFNRLSDLQPLGTAPITPVLYFNPVSTTTFNGNDVMMPGYNATTPGNAIPFGGPQNFIQYYQDWSHVMGRHTLRFGGSYNYIQDNRAFGAYEEPVGAFSTSGSFNWAAMNRLMGGYWGYYNGAVNPQGSYPCAFPITGTNTGCYDGSGNHVPSGEVALPVGPPDFTRSNRYQEFALYVSDSWKATRKLTLTLGLRYEYFGTQHNVNPKLDSNYYFNGGGSNEFERIANGNVLLAPNSPIGELWKPSPKNFGPKVGFAYDIQGNGKTVLRGGYSIAYERNFGNVTFNVIQNPPNYEVVALTDGGNTGVGSMGVTTNPAGPLAGSSGVVGLPGASLRAVNPNINQSYAQLYSLTVEHQIQPNVIFGLDFSGSRGIHLYDIANINSYGAGAVFLGDANPLARLRTTQYANINYRSSGGISSYNALVARIQMNNWAKHGLTLNANYTYGHTLDELSDTFSSSINQNNLGYLDPYNPRLDYGNSYMDVRNRFNLSAVWEVPFAKGTTGFVKQIADGWTVAPLFIAETGFPYTVYDSTNAYAISMRAVNANGGIPKGAPHSMPIVGADDYIYTPFYSNYDSSGNPTAGAIQYFDSSYVNPITGTSDWGPFPAAMTGRNAFRGPGSWNVDLGIYKLFYLGERFRLQFRGELYNAFNHANLYAQTGSNDIGSGYTYLDARRGYNENLLIPTNGSFRTVQLALRLTF